MPPLDDITPRWVNRFFGYFISNHSDLSTALGVAKRPGTLQAHVSTSIFCLQLNQDARAHLLRGDPKVAIMPPLDGSVKMVARFVSRLTGMMPLDCK
jgi:hypothetical protein